MRASQIKGDRYEEGYISGYKDASMEFVEDLIQENMQDRLDYLIKKWEAVREKL